MTNNAASKTKADRADLTSSIARAFKSKSYTNIATLLHQNRPSRAISRDPASLSDDWRLILDVASSVSNALDGADRALSYALFYTALDMDYTSFLRTKEEFAEGMSTLRENSLYRQEQEHLFEALSNHQYARSMRDEFMLLSRSEALDVVKAAWESGDTKGFLYVVSALTTIQNRTQRLSDPKFTEGTFGDAIASHPGLECVIIPVHRGNAIDGGGTEAPLPPLRLIVSNKPIPVAYEDEPKEESSTGFILASASGIYPSLKSYMIDALSQRNESIGHGPYYLTSNDDRGLATASNVIASIHRYLAVPTNFTFDAQSRLKDQMEAIRNIAVGSTYAHRYLRSEKECDWSEALNFANGLKKELELLDPRSASEALVLHGYARAIEDLFNIRLSGDDTIEEARIGYLQGLSSLTSDMVELIHAERETTAALERYESYRGFHPDVLLFPVEERARLAFQDLSDMVTAHLTGLTIQGELLDDAQPLASRIDFVRIIKAMVTAGDLTNAMRVRDSIGVKRSPMIADAINRAFQDLGYHVFPELEIKTVEGLRGGALLDSQGNIFSKPSRTPHYQSVDQITSSTDLLPALFAYHVLMGLKFTNDVAGKQAEQIASLKDFIARRSLVRELKDNMKELPEPLRPVYLDGVTLDADELAEDLAAKGVRNPQDAVKQAISEVSGNKPKAAFHRIMKALENVSELMNSKSKG